MNKRDREVARETVRPRAACHHCNPGVDTAMPDIVLTITDIDEADLERVRDRAVEALEEIATDYELDPDGVSWEVS